MEQMAQVFLNKKGKARELRCILFNDLLLLVKDRRNKKTEQYRSPIALPLSKQKLIPIEDDEYMLARAESENAGCGKDESSATDKANSRQQMLLQLQDVNSWETVTITFADQAEAARWRTEISAIIQVCKRTKEAEFLSRYQNK